MSSSYQDLILNRQHLVALADQAKREYEQQKEAYSRDIQRIDRKLALLDRKLHIGSIERAEAVLEVAGKLANIRTDRDGHGANTRQRAVEDAISDIALGCQKLRKEYIGVKNFEAFGDQRTDCKYWMGPRHGSIVFRIALTDKGKRVLDQWEETFPTEECIYYLRNLKTIQEAE